MTKATSQYLNTGTPIGNEIDRLRTENKALRDERDQICDAFRELSDLYIQVIESNRPIYALNLSASEIETIDARLAEFRAARAALNGEKG